MAKLLLIDDDVVLADTWCDWLILEAYEIECAYTGYEGVSIARSFKPEIILLDINLPDIDGFEVLKKIREFSETYIMLISGDYVDEKDKQHGFELGANDYWEKPLNTKILLAKLKAVVRDYLKIKKSNALVFGSFTIDFVAMFALKEGKRIKLSPLEFAILNILISNAGTALTDDFIMDNLSGKHFFLEINALRTHISNIRRKIETNRDKPNLIITVKNYGYRFEGHKKI